LIACSHRYDTVVTRGGSVRSFHVEGTTSGQLIPIIRANISKEAFIISDELKVYGALGKEYWMHQTVNHSIGEYVRGIVHTNTVEGFYSTGLTWRISAIEPLLSQHPFLLKRQ
jgi:ISXO2-like transposase domain